MNFQLFITFIITVKVFQQGQLYRQADNGETYFKLLSLLENVQMRELFI